VDALAMLLAATFRRKLAALSPDVAIESVLIRPRLPDKSYPSVDPIRKKRSFALQLR
jgi:hypothetical protein